MGRRGEQLDGSTYFVGSSRGPVERIALYLNLDMIGSPNFGRFIYDGNGSKFEVEDPGSAAIERTFERYFDSQDLASGPRSMAARTPPRARGGAGDEGQRRDVRRVPG